MEKALRVYIVLKVNSARLFPSSHELANLLFWQARKRLREPRQLGVARYCIPRKCYGALYERPWHDVDARRDVSQIAGNFRGKLFRSAARTLCLQ